MGTCLFLGSKAGFEPTEHGREALAIAEPVEVRMEGLSDALAEPEHGARGLVRLLANPWMLERLAETRLSALVAENPRLEFRLSGRLPPAPVRGGITMSLWFDAEARPPDIAIPIGHIPYAAYRATSLPEESGDRVIFRDDNARGSSFTRQVSRRLAPDREVRHTATDAKTHCAVARAGIGRAVLPTCIEDEAPDLVRDEAARPIERFLHLHLNPEMKHTAARPPSWIGCAHRSWRSSAASF